MTEIGRHTFHFDPMRQDPGSVTQYPLRLAYAMTIHKSQGLTLDRALIDIRAAREPGQAYVALSRLRGAREHPTHRHPTGLSQVHRRANPRRPRRPCNGLGFGASRRREASRGYGVK